MRFYVIELYVGRCFLFRCYRIADYKYLEFTYLANIPESAEKLWDYLEAKNIYYLSYDWKLESIYKTENYLSTED